MQTPILRSKYIFITLMMLLVWASLFAVSSYSTHTLSKQTLLKNAKMLADRATIFGGFPFDETRNPLYLNKLRMGTWHGFQEVYVNHFGKLITAEIEGELADNSYLWFFIGTHANRRIGLRISRSKDFKSGFYWLDENTRLKSIQTFTINELEKFSLKLNFHQNKITATVNSETFSLREPLDEETFLAIRSDTGDSKITNIKTEFEDKTFNISFWPEFSLKYFLLSLTVTLFSSICGFWFFKSVENLGHFLTLIFSLIFLFFVLDAGLLPQHYTFGKFSSLVELRDQLVFRIERKLNFKAKKDPIPEKIKDWYVKELYWSSDVNLKMDLKNVDRKWYDKNGQISYLKDFSEVNQKKGNQSLILFLGASQTWSLGPSRQEASYPSIMVKELNQQKYKDKSWVGLNISKRAAMLKDLELVFNEVNRFTLPDLIFMHLGVNDQGDLKNFSVVLKRLLEHAQKHKIKVILSLESKGNEYHNLQDAVPENTHTILKDFAKKYGVPVINCREALAGGMHDFGLLWRDDSHMYDAGHFLFAQYFVKMIKKKAP